MTPCGAEVTVAAVTDDQLRPAFRLLNPRELGFQKSFDIIIMVVLGGMGSISGAVLAAILLTILPEALRAFSDYRMILYASALIAMMLLRPQGLFGLRELWEVGPFRRKTPKLGGEA